MPKLLRSDDGWFSLEQMLSDPWSTRDLVDDDGTRGGAVLVENEQEDMREALAEMRQRQQGSFVADSDCQAMDDELRGIWKKHVGCEISLPHSFLRKHGAKLLQA